MNSVDLSALKTRISELSDEDKKNRDLYLKSIAEGKIYGPLVGYPDIDKPWLQFFSNEAIKESLPRQKFIDYLLQCNESNMNKIALSYFGNTISYNDMFNRHMINVAKALLAFGIKQGDYVSVCLPTIPETFYIVYACNVIGAVANLIDPRINEERIEQCLSGKSKIVFTIDAYAEKMSHIRLKQHIKNMIQVKASNSLNTIMKMAYTIKYHYADKEFIDWGTFLRRGIDTEVIKSSYRENQTAVIIYTSGTTGVPKGVQITNENIIGVSVQQKHVLRDMKAGDTFLDCMPPFLAYGLVCGMCASISTGLNLILIPKFDAKKFDLLVLKYKTNHVLGVPAFFENIVNSKKINKSTDLSFLKYCIAGGDKLNIESEKRINIFFVDHHAKSPIIKGYGMSELSSGVIITAQSEFAKLGSAGTPLVKNSVMVLSTETGEELSYREQGELYVSGPTIMRGYENNPEEENKVIYKDVDGKKWVRTGDLAQIDIDGNVEIKGRIKRMIVRPDGHNVFPSVIEDLLITHPAVEKCVVVGIKEDDMLSGAVPTAFVVINEAEREKEQEIKKQLINLSAIKLPPRDVACEYVFIEDLPMTANGKIDYKALEKYCKD